MGLVRWRGGRSWEECSDPRVVTSKTLGWEGEGRLRRRAAGEGGTQRWEGRMDAVTWVKTHYDLCTLPFLLYFPSIKKTKKVKTHSPKFSYHLIPTSPPAFVVLLKSVSRYFWKVWAFSFPWCAVLCLVTQLCPTLCNPMDCSPPGSSIHGDSPGKNSRVGCHALLQGIFPTQVSHVAGRFFTIWATRETPPQYSDI